MAMTSAFSSLPRLQGCSHKISHSAKTKPTTNITQIPNSRNNYNALKWSIPQHDHPLVSTPPPSCTDMFAIEEAQKMKDVRQLLCNVAENPYEGLVMIDAIQRLSIEHHFQSEIEALLKEYVRRTTSSGDFGSNLSKVALGFRLLRQEGYYVSTDVFDKFKDMEGNFEQRLSKDTRGLMELYEASHLSVEGEDILDEAKDFSSRNLEAQMAQLDHLQARVVGHTLAHPHHMSLARPATKNLPNYNLQGTSSSRWMNVLSELARTDSSMMQSIHQMEMRQISKWWQELGLAKDLKFARDQPLKWYMWSVAFLTHPSLSEERVDLTKPISLIYVIDDIFDVVGTLEELTLFTQAINRWELDERLPDYMKISFKALDKITNEVGFKVYAKHGWNPIQTLRKTWANLCNAFLVEAKWFNSGRLPEAKEYLKNGIVSSSAYVMLIHTFFLLGEGISKETVDRLDESPIISSPATILRLWDDLGAAKDENQEGHDGSYIECYLREHPGSTVEMARERVTKMISDAQKRFNGECLFPSPFPASFRRACLNLARMVPLMYAYDDNQRLPLLEEQMESLLYGAVSP